MSSTSDINIGDIYCYSDKSIMSPEEYKSKRRTSGMGIVVSNNYGIVRIASINEVNGGNPYRLINLTSDLNGIPMYKSYTDALRDLSGRTSTNKLLKYHKSCDGSSVLNRFNNIKKGETEWYIPSLGELDRLSKAYNDIKNSLEISGLSDSYLYKVMLMEEYIMSITQSNESSIYGMNIKTNEVGEIGKSNYSYGVLFKLIS